MATNCILCDTPLQVFNALNLYVHSKTQLGPADLIVVDQFHNAVEIVDRIQALGLFERVILASRNPTDVEKKTPVIHDIRRIVDMLKPELVISRQLGVDIKSVVEKFQYRRIYSSVMTKLVCSLLQINPDVEFFLFDDGSGSYCGDITKAATFKNILLSKLLKKGQYAAEPKALYVNNVAMCSSTAAQTILPLPAIDQEFVNYAERVFADSKVEDTTRKIIYLTQPQDDGEDIRNDVKNVLKVMREYEDQLLIRFHPRDIGNTLYEGFVSDSTKAMWEMRVAITEDFDNYIIVGPHSTAQQSPKMFFDKEPVLIYIHYLLPAGYRAHFTACDRAAEALRSIYRNPEKIMIPQTCDELKLCLDKAIAMIR